MNKKTNHGGKRPGAGRPKKAPTGTISCRVSLPAANAYRSLPEAKKKKIKTKLENEINRMIESGISS